MKKILNKKIHIVTMGENIKHIIHLIENDTKRLQNLICDTSDEKAKELYSLEINHNNLLINELKSQLDKQV